MKYAMHGWGQRTLELDCIVDWKSLRLEILMIDEDVMFVVDLLLFRKKQKQINNFLVHIQVFQSMMYVSIVWLHRCAVGSKKKAFSKFS